MILAAGFGTRLLPHTQIRPKPLFPILNKPLLLLTITRLQNLGFDHIVVNCHHLRQQVVAALHGLKGVVVQEEEVILGTGGGLRRALCLMRDEPLLVCNGDIYHTVDLLDFYQRHCSSGKAVTLALHDLPRFNSVRVKDENIVGFTSIVDSTCLAFTGLHVMDPAILSDIVDGQYSCIIDQYRKIIEKGVEITWYRTDGCFWTDMGTPEDYLALHQGLLTGAIPAWEEIGLTDRPFCVDPGAKFGTKIQMHDWVCLGHADIGDGCCLQRVVVWDDVAVPGGSRLIQTILSSGH